MGKDIVQMTARSVSSAYDRFKCGNPLMMRKKFQMKDVWFRRDQPDIEIFRCELAFDVQLYVILIAVLCAAACIIAKASCTLRKIRTHHTEKAYYGLFEKNTAPEHNYINQNQTSPKHRGYIIKADS